MAVNNLEQLATSIEGFRRLNGQGLDNAIGIFLNEVCQQNEIMSMYGACRAYCDFILAEPPNIVKVRKHIPKFYEILQAGLDRTGVDGRPMALHYQFAGTMGDLLRQMSTNNITAFETDVPLEAMWYETSIFSAEGSMEFDKRFATLQYLSAADAAYAIFRNRINGDDRKTYGNLAQLHYTKFFDLSRKTRPIPNTKKMKRIKARYVKFQNDLKAA